MTDSGNDIVITSLGAVTPVGGTADETFAAIHAGINSVNEHAYFECTPHDPEWDDDLTLYVSTVPIIDPFLDGMERFIELAIPALTEVLEKADLSRNDLNKTGLFIALPLEDAATFNLKLYTHFMQVLCKQMGLSRLKLTKINKNGKTGFFELIAESSELIKSGELTYAIVGGVDSYLLEDRLTLLDQAWRIKSERNVDGFIPGEAAAMVMLEMEENARKRGISGFSRIKRVATACESETLASQKKSTGVGLSSAIRDVVDSSNTYGVESVYCSLNGESYFAFEWGLQLTRLSSIFSNLKHLVHPIENCGDMGSATGGILLACASNKFLKDKQASNLQSLLWLSGDNENRSALTLAPI